MTKKRIKRKLNIKGLIVILLSLYLIVMFGYYIVTLPIKTIVVKGIVNLSDSYVIEQANISESSSLFRTTSLSIINKLEKIDLVKSVKIKKNLKGILTIIIEENRVLMFNSNTNSYVLENGKEIAREKAILGVPTLINYTPTDIYNALIKNLKETDQEVLSLISEIKYEPDEKDGVVIDENRFVMWMNDGNMVHINIANFEKINEYRSLYAKIEEGKKGTFYLDGSIPRVLFKTYESEKTNEVGDQNELSE